MATPRGGFGPEQIDRLHDAGAPPPAAPTWTRAPPGVPHVQDPRPLPFPPPPLADPGRKPSRGWVVATWVLLGVALLSLGVAGDDVVTGIGLAVLFCLAAMVTGIVGAVVGNGERRRGTAGAGGRTAWGLVGASVGLVGAVALVLLLIFILVFMWFVLCLFTFGLAC